MLLSEALHFLALERGGIFVDCTLGMGGHAAAILEFSAETKVIGIDRDSEAIEKAVLRLSHYGTRFEAIHADFRLLRTVIEKSEIRPAEILPSGILADLGVSSWQLDSEERGFSFRFDAPLDMRMNAKSSEPTAADLLKQLSEEEIANIIYQYGEERFSRRIARRIVEARENKEPVETTDQLAGLVARAVKAGRHERVHPATRTFQALRIAVNRELENLDLFLRDAVEVLEAGGRLAVISFHSLEDRIVKQTFRKLSGVCECPPRLPVCQCGAVERVKILTGRPIVPGEAEQESNPRARSAKLRVCQKI